MDDAIIDTIITKKGKPDELINMSIKHGLSLTAKRCTIKIADSNTLSISSSSTSYVADKIAAHWLVNSLILNTILSVTIAPKISDNCGRCGQTTKDEISPKRCTLCKRKCHPDAHCFNANAQCCKECSTFSAKIYTDMAQLDHNTENLTTSMK